MKLAEYGLKLSLIGFGVVALLLITDHLAIATKVANILYLVLLLSIAKLYIHEKHK